MAIFAQPNSVSLQPEKGYYRHGIYLIALAYEYESVKSAFIADNHHFPMRQSLGQKQADFRELP